MKDRTPILVVIGGPTASGKTAAAVALARRLGTEVMGADSRQFYRDMRIGTARPSVEELGGVPHHFIGHLALPEQWNAGSFAHHAEPVLQDILSRHGIAILCGGSSLYIDALLKGLDDLPRGDPHLRMRLEQRAALEGLPALVAELEHLDPAIAAHIDRRNPHRVFRALEVCLLSGAPYSAQRSSPQDRTDLRIVRFALDVPRETLYQRIDRRVDQMVADGLVDEVSGLLPFRDHPALRTVGYRELFAHIDGTTRMDEAIRLIKRNTRHYARRQMTWLRRARDHWRWIGPGDDLAIRALASLAS